MDPGVKLIVWLVFLAIGCFGAPYGYQKGYWWIGYGGGLFLFIAILMMHFMKF